MTQDFGCGLGFVYVQSRSLEMNMVAEGYNASKCIYLSIKIWPGRDASMIRSIRSYGMPPEEGFRELKKKTLV